MNLDFLTCLFRFHDYEFSYAKFLLLVGIICFSLYTLFGTHLFRRNECSKKGTLENSKVYSSKDSSSKELRPAIETESKSIHDLGTYRDEFPKKDEIGVCLQFKFPSYEEFCKDGRENGDYLSSDPVISLSEVTEEPDISKVNDEVLSMDERHLKIDPEDKEIIETEEERENHGQEDEQIPIQSESPSIYSSPSGLVSSQSINLYSDQFLNDTHFVDELEYENVVEKDEHCYENVGKLKSEFLTENDFCGESETGSEKRNSNEQLQTELKKTRDAGLPTIQEESESPKIVQDLKPWKIDNKSRNTDRMVELNKFYKSYKDRMRKLDILNYQKMYAIGFLQLKDPLQSVSTFLSHNLFPCKRKKIGNDPMMNFIIGLQSDLEIIYVGHMCLSWEILHWQYGKALELRESDPCGIRIYNEVAADFQRFQVLMQRFIEDETFQGPRVQNYVKSRCALRKLLQVPLIKRDSTKDRKKALKGQESGDFAIKSDTLVEILEESMRIFWCFVRADKDCSNMVAKSPKGLHIELQDPADFDLLAEVQANLQKKEKKLKDLLRGGNCILNKFKKREENDSDQVLYFFSQVDMKLVGRVLNMPRITTDQLLWCRNILRKISFVSNKMQVEPSFLLFPC